MKQPRSAAKRRATAALARKTSARKWRLPAGYRKMLAENGAKGGAATGPTKRAGARKAWRKRREARPSTEEKLKC